MTTAIKRRRGTTTQHSTFTGLEGEITVDTTKDTVVVHDGSTAGGFALLREDLSNNTNVASTSTAQTFTNKTFGDNPVLSAGTANGVAYLNGSKVLTTGSALTYNGAMLSLTYAGEQLRLVGNGTTGYIRGTDGTNNLWYIGQGGVAGLQLYTYDTNPISFYVNSNEQMRLTSTGLGIGTSSPSYKLDVRGVTASGNGTITTGFSYSTRGIVGTLSNHTLGFMTNGTESMYLDTSGNLGLGITPSAWGSYYPSIQGQGASAFTIASKTNEMQIAAGIYQNNSFQNLAAAAGSTRGAKYSQNPGTGAHTWWTNNTPVTNAGDVITFTQAMTLDASGNLMVGGTTSVNGIAISKGSGSNALIEAAANGNTIGSTSSLYGQDTASNVYCWNRANAPVLFGTNNTERMRIDSSGNLLVGTTSAVRKLTVATNGSYDGIQLTNSSSTTATRLSLTNNNSKYLEIDVGSSGRSVYGAAGPDIVSMTSGALGFNIGTDNASPLAFYTNNGEQMRIDSSGNLIVGGTALYQTGAVSISKLGNGANSSGNIFFNSAGTSNYPAIFQYNGSNVGYITYNATTVSYVSLSDYRLKENIQPMQNALARNALLKPCTYSWKADGSTGEGFIAHELQAVCPDAVTGEKDAVDKDGKPVYQGVDTSFLVGHLVACIQELKAELDELKAKVG